MKQLLAMMIILITNSFAGTFAPETKEAGRLNNKIEKRVGDIAFKLEMEYPNQDDAWYLAYKSCGETDPELPRDHEPFDQFTEYKGDPKGYQVIYYYGHNMKMPYHYRCKEVANVRDSGR